MFACALLLTAVSCRDRSGGDEGGAGSTGSSGSSSVGSESTGASSSSDADGSSSGTDTAGELCTVIVDEADCDRSLRPFVFVHGTYGSGADFANVAALLGSNGYCQDRIVAVDYDSLGDEPGVPCEGGAPPSGCGKIDAAIEAVLAANPEFDRVDLAGHSQGTSHCGTYLADPGQRAKVAHYINFSGVPMIDGVPTLSLSSERDLAGFPHHATGDEVTQVTFADEDHFAVAASRRAFVEVYRFLVEQEPEHETVQCGAEMAIVEGVTESFADNVPETGMIEVRRAGAIEDTTADPIEVLTPDADGHFGPVALARGFAYEFKGFDVDGNVVGYQYLPPLLRSNRLVRLLVPSSSPLIASLSTDRIVRGPNHSAIVARWAGGGLRHDLGASLTIDGVEVLTSQNAGEDALAMATLDGGVVGFFMSDYDENGQTDLGLVASAPFLSFTDVFMDASEPRMMELVFSAGSEDVDYLTSVRVPSWPSSDALILVTF